MTEEKLTPERAVRLLRAKAGELEASVLPGLDRPDTEVVRFSRDLSYLAADIALIASLLADHIERTMRTSRSDRPTDPHQ